MPDVAEYWKHNAALLKFGIMRGVEEAEIACFCLISIIPLYKNEMEFKYKYQDKAAKALYNAKAP